MPIGYTGDEEEKAKTPADEQAELSARVAAAPAPTQTNYQKTYQTPQLPTSTPGQQTPMPWTGSMPGLGQGGQSPTPWAQNAPPPAAVQAFGNGGSGAIGGATAPPDWAALAQRFGGGLGAARAPQAAAPFIPGGGGGQGPIGAGGEGRGFQGNPWLQQLIQGLAQRLSAARQGGLGGALQQQGGGFQGLGRGGGGGPNIPQRRL